MHAVRNKRLVALGVVLVFALAVVIVITQPAVARALVAKILGSATGTTMQFGGMALHTNGANLTDVRISVRGEQLAQVPALNVKYNLRDLLPGSTRLYGLESIVIRNPRITVVHNADGTYNLPKLARGGPSRAGGTPMNLTLRVIGGTLAVIDNTRLDPSARRIQIGAVTIDADVHSAARTAYHATMAYMAGGAAYPIRGAGIMDAPAGFNLQHWTAAHVPLPQLVNYALNNAGIRMRAGYLDNVDARYYGNFAASATMRGARITMANVSAPITGVHGPLDMTSAGLTTSGLVASVAGAPVYVTGGIYDLSAPQFRLNINTHSDIARLKGMSAAAAGLPLRGPVDLSMLVQGSVRAPLAMIALRSPEIDFRELPLRNAAGTIAFDGKTANILHLTLRYAGFSAGVRGRVALNNEPNAIEAFAGLSGSSAQVPYANAVLADMPLQATLLASGNSLSKVRTQGTLSGTSPEGDLASRFAITATGVGTVALNYRGLAAKVAIDHPHNRIAALVNANDLTVSGDRVAELPGLHVSGMPPLRGTISGDLFALQESKALGLSGTVDVRDAAFSGMRIAQAHAQFGGAPGNVQVANLNASGSFGSLQAHGTMSGTSHLALEGHLHGSLSALASVAGNLPASGTIDAPVALVYDGGRSIAQVQDAQFSGASIRGVPINALSATVGTQGKAVQIYAASARVAQTANAVASGTFGAGGSHLALSVSNLQLAALRLTGLPLQSGVANLGATADGSFAAPSVNGSIVLDRAQMGRYPVTADTSFAYAGDTLNLRDALVGVGPAFVALEGSVGGLRMGAPLNPQYDLNASMRALDVHDTIALFSPRMDKQYIEGSVDANVHVGGSGTLPAIAGSFVAPEGSVHGLAFRSLHGTFAGTGTNLQVTNGGVVVGSTALAFNAALSDRHLSAGLRAPHADLADFNDYFDAGDMFAGNGRLALNLDSAGSSVSSSGSINLHNVRFRRYPIGETLANWHMQGQSIVANADIGGSAGRVLVNGTYTPRGSMNMTSRLRGFDLGTWLPLLGYRAPVTGHIDADATARGRYPDVDLALRGNVVDGTVGRVHIEQAQVAMTAARGRGQIQQAVVRIPNLTAQGSGTFGLHPNDPLALSLHATSADLGRLMTTITGKTYDAGGSLDTVLAVTGTRAQPQLRDTFTLAALRYQKLTVPKLRHRCRERASGALGTRRDGSAARAHPGLGHGSAACGAERSDRHERARGQRGFQ